jgi:hypothetical protein
MKLMEEPTSLQQDRADRYSDMYRRGKKPINAPVECPDRDGPER